MKPRYFVQPATRWCCRRYCLLGSNGRTVVAVQASRPDGEEVPMPCAVAWTRPAERTLLAPAAKRLHAAGGIDIARRRVLRRCACCQQIKPREEFMAPSGRGQPREFCRACREETET